MGLLTRQLWYSEFPLRGKLEEGRDDDDLAGPLGPGCENGYSWTISRPPRVVSAFTPVLHGTKYKCIVPCPVVLKRMNTRTSLVRHDLVHKKRSNVWINLKVAFPAYGPCRYALASPCFKEVPLVVKKHTASAGGIGMLIKCDPSAVMVVSTEVDVDNNNEIWAVLQAPESCEQGCVLGTCCDSGQPSNSIIQMYLDTKPRYTSSSSFYRIVTGEIISSHQVENGCYVKACFKWAYK
ncbi:hypothetical protein JOM56_013686 [Amanita muscaria]